MWVLIGLSLVLVILIHWLITSPYGYWKKRGVPFPKPVPIFGNIGKYICMRKSFGEVITSIYNEYKDCLYVGIYSIRKPVILIRDPELIKSILVKDFANFHDNDFEINEKDDPLLARNPFALRGHKWKVVRAQVTANITTGKIKNMHYLIKNVGKNMVTYLDTEATVNENEGLEAKELAAKFTTDVVASCAFGLEANSFTDSEAEFRKMGRKILNPSFWTGVKHMILFMFPSFSNLFHVRFIPKDVHDWFVNTLTETMSYREKNNVTRNDYLDMLMSLKSKPGEYEFTDMDVMAQAMTFFADGFETSSVVLSFCLYELAENPEIQTKLRKEIETVLAKHEDEVSYDAIMDMPYLDMILSETLRKYPPGVTLLKMCTNSYTFPPARGEGTGANFQVEKGTSINIPIYGLHHDPEYYPEPDKFNPERFTEDNKNSRPKCTYIPFGEGPRQCLGYRFALTQIKTAVVYVIKNFELTVNPKTRRPLEFDPGYIMIAIKGGLWLNFQKRSKQNNHT